MTEETQSPITTEQPNFEQLLLLLKSKNKEGRCKAVNTMAESGDSRAVIALIEMLHDETPVVQYTAIWGLLKLEDKRAIPPLMAVLQNKRSVATSVRSQAAESLGELKAVQALELLCAVAEDSTEDLEVRQAALEGVSYFNEPQVDKLPLNCFLDKTIPTDLRYDAVGLLGELQVKGCFDMLVVALQDQSEPGEIRANDYGRVFRRNPSHLITLLCWD